MQTVTTIGLDIAKSVFQVHGIDAEGKVLIRRQLKRRYVLAFFEKLPPCVVGIEACATSHHWSRALKALGHNVRLMPPAYVKPYVKRQKNDAADAEAHPDECGEDRQSGGDERAEGQHQHQQRDRDADELGLAVQLGEAGGAAAVGLDGEPVDAVVADRLVHVSGRVGVVQRDRAFGVGDQRHRPAGAAGEVLAEERDVTEGGRHQQELGIR